MKSGDRQRQTRHILAEQGFKARGVVAIELVKHPQLLLMRQASAIVIHPRGAGFGVNMVRIVGDIGVSGNPQREGKAAIVHRCIFGIVLQPLARVAKVFAKDKRLRLSRFRRTRDPGHVLKVISRPPASPSICTTSRRQPSIFHGAFSQ